MIKPIQETLLEEYKDFLHFKANKYSKAGLEYNDIFNQGYLFLLENYPLHYLCPETLKKIVDRKLRTYYNHEFRERHINYGTNQENISL